MALSVTQAGYVQQAHGSGPLLPGVPANTPVIPVPSATFAMRAPVPAVAAPPAPVRSTGWALPPTMSRVADAVGLAAGAGVAIFHGAGEAAHHAAFAMQRADFVTLGIAALVALAAREGIGWLWRHRATLRLPARQSAQELLATAAATAAEWAETQTVEQLRKTIACYRAAAKKFTADGKHLEAGTSYEKAAYYQLRLADIHFHW